MKKNKLKESIMRIGAILAITSAYVTTNAQTHFFSQNNEDIQIYTAVLKHGIPSQSDKILILEDSLVDTFSNNDENLAENLSKETGVSPRCFEEWSLKNRESTNIKFKISSELDISFLSAFDLDTVFNENTAKENWKRFNNLYKNYDGFIAIIDGKGCSAIKSTKIMNNSYTLVCEEKTRDDVALEGTYYFISHESSVPESLLSADLMCVDGSFTAMWQK